MQAVFSVLIAISRPLGGRRLCGLQQAADVFGLCFLDILFKKNKQLCFFLCSFFN